VHLVAGIVVDGKIIVEDLSLPEGTVVTILTPDEKASE